jgi:hypothetical protein
VQDCGSGAWICAVRRGFPKVALQDLGMGNVCSLMPYGQSSAPVQPITQQLSRLEERHMFLVHVDRFPSFGIAAIPGIAFFYREGPEAAQFDPIAARHGLNDLLENCVYDPLDVTMKQMRVFVSKKLNQFGTDHHSPRRRNGFMMSFAGLMTKLT